MQDHAFPNLQANQSSTFYITQGCIWNSTVASYSASSVNAVCNVNKQPETTKLDVNMKFNAPITSLKRDFDGYMNDRVQEEAERKKRRRLSLRSFMS